MRYQDFESIKNILAPLLSVVRCPGVFLESLCDGLATGSIIIRQISHNAETSGYYQTLEEKSKIKLIQKKAISYKQVNHLIPFLCWRHLH